MLNVQFAEASSSGISSLGLNLKGFLFNLITLLIVFLILRRYVWPKIVITLEARRMMTEQSIAQARQVEEALAKAEVRAEELLANARVEADKAMADAKVRVEQLIASGEKAADERGTRIIQEAEGRLAQERERLHSELKGELSALVVATTEKVLRKKLNESEDRNLIEESLKELA